MVSDESLEPDGSIGGSGLPRGMGPSRRVHIGGAFTSVGRDLHNHIYPYEAPKDDIMTFLEEIDNCRQIHQDTLSKATPRTGEWLLSHERFPIWRNPREHLKTIWGSGIPGAGKTVLTSLAIDGIEKWAKEKNLPACVCFLYIRYSDNAKLTIRHCLEVFVKQAVEKHPCLLNAAKKVYAEHIRLKTRPTEAELLLLLRHFTIMVAVTFYFLDALDEAPSQLQFDLLSKLSSLDVKLFVTSRSLKVLEAHFPDCHRFTIDAHNSDLDLHINNEIQRSPHLRLLLDKTDASWRSKIVLSVKEKCGGMFLHASLQMAALQECTSIHDVEETLEAFPARVEEVYILTWERIIDQPPKISLLAQACILWVLYATRSMTVEELRYAVATDPKTHSFNDKRLVDEDALIAPCRGLLVVDEESHLVRLVHYTANGTLRRLVANTYPRPHSLLAAVCITYLFDHRFQDWGCGPRPQPSLSSQLETVPFLSYAYDAWSLHVRESLDDQSSTSLATQFVQGCRAFPVKSGSSISDLLGPLHLVAFCDLPLVLAGIEFDTIHDPNSTTLAGETPLHVACIYNSENTAKDLLQVPSLLVNAPNGNQETALMLATKFFLSRPGSGANPPDIEEGEPASTSAARHGLPVIIRLLLAHPETEVNLVDVESQTPLLRASKEGHAELAELFLARPDVDVNLADNQGFTPLIWAAKGGHIDILTSLISHSQIEANCRDENGRTALSWALTEGHAQAVRILLAQSDVDVNLPDRKGRTPLRWVSKMSRGCSSPTYEQWSQLVMFKLLLDHPRTDVNATDTKGQTVLISMAKAQEDRKVLLGPLLSHPRVDVNIKDCIGRTALHWASKGGHTSTVGLLVSHPQIDVNSIDEREGRTALIWALQSSPTDFTLWRYLTKTRPLRALLSHPQVDVNTADKQGKTALIYASKVGDLPSATLLLAHPTIQVSLADKHNRTALDWAEMGRHPNTVNLLRAHSQSYLESSIHPLSTNPIQSSISILSGESRSHPNMVAFAAPTSSESHHDSSVTTTANTTDEAGSSFLPVGENEDLTGTKTDEFTQDEIEPVYRGHLRRRILGKASKVVRRWRN